VSTISEEVQPSPVWVGASGNFLGFGAEILSFL
jgi:hypothetical protein